LGKVLLGFGRLIKGESGDSLKVSEEELSLVSKIVA